MLNKNYAIMKQEEKKEVVTLKVTPYEAEVIFRLLLEKGRRFNQELLPSISRKYYILANKILKQLEKCEYKD